jgi:ATP-binding cassette subfamily F protein uup
VQEYVGGYEDWLRQRPAPESERPREPPRTPPAVREESAAPKKLSYRERDELQRLPERIEALEREQAALEQKIQDPNFYKEPAGVIAASLARVEAIQDELLHALARWDELESRPQ